MANEPQADISNAYRLLEQFVKRYFLEGILVLLVSLSIISSIISWARAERAIDANKDLKAIVIGLQTSAMLEQEMYGETERECRLAQAHISDFRIALFKAGIEVEHTGEAP
jgi:hypothetical protein